MRPEVECCGSKFGLYVLIVVGLVAFAGLMAGLTLGLTSLGLVDLEVLFKAGKTQDRKHACEGHAVLLRRAELKTFVNFHGNEAGKGGDLRRDETTIITGALELTEKTVKDAMTHIANAFTLDLDGVLNLRTLNKIMTVGHSRIPVYYRNPRNIVGLILIKNLFTVDREDAVPLRKMIIRKIPRVKEDMPLYDILNEFQKGHSHIAVVVRVINETKEMVKKTIVEHDDTNKRHQVQSSHSETTQKNELNGSDVDPTSNTLKSTNIKTTPTINGGDQHMKKSKPSCSCV